MQPKDGADHMLLIVIRFRVFPDCKSVAVVGPAGRLFEAPERVAPLEELAGADEYSRPGSAAAFVAQPVLEGTLEVAGQCVGRRRPIKGLEEGAAQQLL